jgi:hypothetical protein
MISEDSLAQNSNNDDIAEDIIDDYESNQDAQSQVSYEKKKPSKV